MGRFAAVKRESARQPVAVEVEAWRLSAVVEAVTAEAARLPVVVEA